MASSKKTKKPAEVIAAEQAPATPTAETSPAEAVPTKGKKTKKAKK